MRRAFLSIILLLSARPALAEDPLAVLAKTGKENAVARLVAIREVSRTHDPLAGRILAAAYARLEADPAGGFSEPEKVAALQALAAFREPAAGPCACKALSDPSREVRRVGLGVIRELRHAQAAPFLIGLMAAPGSDGGDQTHPDEDLALAQQAGDLMEILTNASRHFESLSSPAERQVAVTRWRKWWEDHQNQPRVAWQQEGFQEEKIAVTLPRDSQESMKAEDVSVLLDALADVKPVWIRENAQELLSAIPVPPPAAKSDRPACAALAKGLDHSDSAVGRRTAVALRSVLMKGGYPDLPDPPMPSPEQLQQLRPEERQKAFDTWEDALREGMKSWWTAHLGR